VTGLMLVEGYHELSLAWEARVQLKTLFICCELLRPEETRLLNIIEDSGVEIIEVQETILKKISYRENPDAWLGIAQCPTNGLEGLGKVLDASFSKPLLLLCENLEKPGNLGAILRSADAAGAQGVLVCEGRTDLYNPNVVRAGKGTIFSQQVIECSNQEAYAWLKNRGIQIIAASPAGTKNYWDLDLQQPCVIAVGAEKEGLSDFWMSKADALVQIPMHGKVNSLNVAQAATLFIYEALRQRS